jgi:hypothetical protein
MEHKMKQMTKEQVELAIASGDDEVMNLVLADEIEYVDEVTEETPAETPENTVEPEVAETPEVTPPVEEKQFVDPVTTPVTDEPKVEGDNIYLDMIKKLEEKNSSLEGKITEGTTALDAKLKEITDAHEAELEKLRAKINPAVTQTPSKKFEEDADDEELANNYSKNNRSEIENLKTTIASLGSGESDVVRGLVEKIGKLEEQNNTIEAERKRDQDAADRNARMDKMFTSIDKFAEGKDHLKLGRGIKEEYKDHTKLRTRISEYLGTDDDSIVNKTLRGLASNETDFFKGMRTKMEELGITIPEGTQNYLKLSDIVDLKRGVTYNSETGVYEDIVDELGNKVCQRSIEDAYKLSNFEGEVTDARVEQSIEIQKQLSNREGSAVSIPPEDLSQGNEEDVMTTEQMNSILDMDPRKIKRNPELMKKYNLIVEKLKRK